MLSKYQTDYQKLSLLLPQAQPKMKSITIICIGKIKQAQRYLVDGIEEYQQRLKGQLKIEWIEIPEKNTTPEQQAEQIKRYFSPQAHIILLDENGEMMDSISFSRRVFGAAPPNEGRGILQQQPMMIVIGGADGLWPKLRQDANQVLSFSKLTWPHQLVRLLLIEQLYRAWMIYQNKPYHKL